MVGEKKTAETTNFQLRIKHRILCQIFEMASANGYRWAGKKASTFDRLWNEKYRAVIQTEMLIYKSKDNFTYILFGKITHRLDQEFRKILVTVCME